MIFKVTLEKQCHVIVDTVNFNCLQKTTQRLGYKRNIIYYLYNHIIPSLIYKLKMQDIKNDDCSY